MTDSSAEALLDNLLARLEVLVAAEGYKRRKKIFRAIVGGNAALIGFQKSEDSSPSRLIFTVNLGIVCGKLLDSERVEVGSADIVHAHLRVRLGMLLENPSDKWWELTTNTDCHQLQDELSSLISQKAIPYLNNYLSTDSLIALWRSGRSPGLTETQRSRYIAQLEAKLGER